MVMLRAQSSLANSANWLPSPPSNDWNSAANWTAGGPPNSLADTATFDFSNATAVSLSATTFVDRIVFNPGASAFTISAVRAGSERTLEIGGAGLTNNSGVTQNLIVAGDASANDGFISFFNSASAGSGTRFTANGATVSGGGVGIVLFSNNAGAGSGSFINSGGVTNNAFGGVTAFRDNSGAANGSFTNHGGAVGQFGGNTVFYENTTAGNGRFTTNGATISGGKGGYVDFLNSSSAGNGVFITNPGTVSGVSSRGFTEFFDSSTANSGSFTNNGSAVVGEAGGKTEFSSTSTAANGVFVNQGAVGSGSFGGETNFFNNTTAANATLTANPSTLGGGGVIYFVDDSTGGTSRVRVFGNGFLDISFHNPPGVMIGSLAGDGDVFLGANTLTVGSGDQSSTFMGTIQDGAGGSVQALAPKGPTGGSVTKVGSGSLTLSGPNTYTGATSVEGGRLLITDASGNGGSNGPISVAAGSVLLAGNATAATGVLTLANDVTLDSGSIIQMTAGPGSAHSTLARAGGAWSFASNQTFTLLDLGIAPGLYHDIITGLAGDPGGVGSWTLSNPGLVGTFSYDGAGNIDLTITAVSGQAPQLTGAVSRKTHGGAGTFDIDLLTGTAVECRGTNGNHAFVFAFNHNVVSGNASITSGEGQTAAPVFAGNTMTVNLAGVIDQQTITLTLDNVTDSLGQVLPNQAINVRMLIGDTNGNRTVSASDIAQTKSQSGAPANGTNFRSDLNASGGVSASDVAQAKANSGHTLP